MPLSVKGHVPLDPKLSACAENGSSYLQEFPESQTSKLFKTIVSSLMSETEMLNSQANISANGQ